MGKKSGSVNIGHFFDFFEARIEFIKQACLDRIEGTILVCCYLDSLAGYRYGGASGRDRLKRFLTEHTDQADVWRKVSLILLRQHFETKDHPFFDGMINFLNKLGASTDNFLNLDFNPDICIDTLFDRAREELPGDDLRQMQHDIHEFEYSSILWNEYRNPSVHETVVSINRAMNLADNEEPFYSNMNVMEGGKITRTITCFDIPPTFLVRTIETGLRSFKELIEKGECTMHLSDSSVRDSTLISVSKRSKTGVDSAYPRMITKPFRPLLIDSGHLLDLAKQCHEKWQSLEHPEDRWSETCLSRSCIVACIFFLESITNCVLRDFAVTEPLHLPSKLRKKTGLHIKDLGHLPLKERVFLTPYLCSAGKQAFSREYFDRGSREFQQMEELIKIRDSFAHSRPIKRRLNITSSGEREYVLDDMFKENFWPLTQIPKDIFIIEYSHAVLAKKIVDWVIDQIDQFLDGKLVQNNWMNSEQIEFAPK